MLEWIWRFLTSLFGKGDANAALTSITAAYGHLNHSYNDLMHAYQKMNQELQDRLDALDDKVASLEAALEREKTEHGECRRKLREHESEIDKLKGQVTVLMQKEKSRGDDAGS